jgi:hypothetical protein
MINTERREEKILMFAKHFIEVTVCKRANVRRSCAVDVIGYFLLRLLRLSDVAAKVERVSCPRWPWTLACGGRPLHNVKLILL